VRKVESACLWCCGALLLVYTFWDLRTPSRRSDGVSLVCHDLMHRARSWFCVALLSVRLRKIILNFVAQLWGCTDALAGPPCIVRSSSFLTEGHVKPDQTAVYLYSMLANRTEITGTSGRCFFSFAALLLLAGRQLHPASYQLVQLGDQRAPNKTTNHTEQASVGCVKQHQYRQRCTT
jgi:hypothetical protein